jgi:putative phosphonoacetaldehyde dehydrogenase
VDLPSYVGGEPVQGSRRITVRSPYSGETVGTVASVRREEVEEAVRRGRAARSTLTRYRRHQVLSEARSLLEKRAGLFASLITAESGLSLRDTTYEVGRACDVLQLAAMEALRDDGQIFPGDITPQGKARKIFTLREPHALMVAITPFNHPLNQVVHKVAPAVAAGVPLILKPSEKTPLTAIRFAELLFEAGYPRELLSVLLGPTAEVAELLVRHPQVEGVTFTGSVEVGKRIAAAAGYKKLALELGGNSPLIVLADADLELAARLAAEGAFRNSGQRCTAVKRILVEEPVVGELTERLVETARGYRSGDPADPGVQVGTVIDEEAAARLERLVEAAVAGGARLLLGGKRKGALFPPTVLGEVPRDAEVVVREAFGPIAKILPVKDLDDAIEVANSTVYGLSSGVVTRSLEKALRAVRSIRTGTVNVNEVPGYRTEGSPFGGVKDSGLGVKEGVVEAMRWMTYQKTFSLPW